MIAFETGEQGFESSGLEDGIQIRNCYGQRSILVSQMGLCAVFEDPPGDEPLGPQREVACGPFAVAFAEIGMRHEQSQHAVHRGAAPAKTKWIPEAIAAPVWVMKRNGVLAKDLNDGSQHVGAGSQEHHGAAALEVI